ncbi:MAG: phosphoribosylanthranilate isomerase [Candidatus Dormibacteria bacterium]
MFVKICGITSEEDALLSVALGADAVGFVFAPSVRQLSPLVAGDIARRLPPEVITVGVFRNEAKERVVEIVGTVGLKVAQLHGKESAAEARWIRERVPSTIMAFMAGDRAIARAADYGADVVLLDAPSPGSGEVFDWRLAEGVADGTPLLLAGGLDPTNVARAIALVHPWGVDVASGVESGPGVKDPAKLRAFITTAKASASPPWRGEGEAPFDWQDS